MGRTLRVAVVVSHPIQHFCPQYTSWAKLANVDLKVFFASDHGVSAYEDAGFGRVVQWNGLRLEFSHEFLRDAKGGTAAGSIDAPHLADRLSTFSPDTVVVYGYSQRLQRRAVRCARSAGASVLMMADSELRAPRSWPVRAMKALVVPSLLRHVTLFLTVGDANEAYYRRYGISDDRFVRCCFPIDVDLYGSAIARRQQCRDQVRSALGIPAHHKVLLTVGKLLARKRQADLVTFSNSLQGHRDDITVVLAGSGPEDTSLRTSARRLGSGGVVFAGFVPPERLAEHYCAADAYVHCADNEPHSLAISEAIYCGLPIVLSDRCGSYGPTDDVQPGFNGFVYRCGDVGEMSRRIMQVLDDQDLSARMCQASTCIGRQHQALAHGKALAQALTILESDGRR
jgi:glycosyltransferase involved in cell wall biosynthesis